MQTLAREPLGSQDKTRLPTLLFYGAAGILCGLLVSSVEPLLSTVVVAGMLAAIVCAMRPLTGVFAVVLLTSVLNMRTDFPGSDIGSIHVPDLLLGYLFALLFARMVLNGQRFVSSPCTLPLLGFAGVGLIALLASRFLHGANFFEALKERKAVFYYLTGILVVNFCDSRRAWKSLSLAVLSVALLVAVGVSVLGVVNAPSPGATPQAVYYSLTDIAGGSEKIIAYWLFCVLLSVLIVAPFRWANVAGMTACLGYFGFMFHRHMYLAAFLGVLLLGALTWRRYKGRQARLALAGSVILLLTALVLAWGPRSVSRYAELTAQRIASLQGIEDTSTVAVRRLENRYAAAAIRQQPFTGIGFATNYRPMIYGPDDTMGWFVHNGYLWIQLKMGLLGSLAFAWLSLRFLRQGWRGWSHAQDPLLQAVVLGSMVTYLGLLAINFITPYFMQNWSVAVIGLMVGLTEAALRVERTKASGA